MHILLQQYFQLIKRFMPSTPEGCAVGLDIGAGECKLVEIVKESDQEYKLVNYATRQVKDGKIAETVRELLDEVENVYDTVYTAVFGKGTLIRYMDLPRMKSADLQNSFAIEADKYFPFAANQIYTDCFILDPEGKEKQMSVMAAASKKEIIDERIALLKGLSIPVNFIGINPIALANALKVMGYESEEKTDEAVALLDMGDSVSSLTILYKKIPRFTRDIFIGGRDLTKRISNALGLEFEEAEKLKRNPGERLDDVMGAAESAVMSLVQELKLSFDYFSTEKNLEINKLLITGGASILDGLPQLLEKNLEVKVCRWDPFSKFKLSEKIDNEKFKIQSLKYGVALGLALYNYD